MEATEAELAAEAELAEATAEEREDAERGVAWAEDGRGDPAKRKRASARSDLEAADPSSHRGARVDAAGRPAGPARKTPKWALMLDAPDATPGKRRRARAREPSTSSEDPLGVAAAEMASESELSDADSDVELLDQDDGVIPRTRSTGPLDLAHGWSHLEDEAPLSPSCTGRGAAPSYDVGVLLRAMIGGWKRRRYRRRAGARIREDSSSGDARGGSGRDLARVAGEAAGAHATLRALSHALKLSPFTLDTLVAALARDTPCALVDDVHLALLGAIAVDEIATRRRGARPRRARDRDHDDDHDDADDDALADRAPTDPRAEPRDGAEYLDALTWPDYLAALLARQRATRGTRRVPRAPLGSRGAEYYALSPMEKAEILTHLCDEVLDTRAAREVINARQDDEMNVFGEDRDDETEPEPGGASGGGDDDDESRGIVDLGVDVVSVVGARVEVFGDEAEGLDGSWYGAEVIASRAARGKGGLASVKVRYDELLADEEEEDDDDARRLEEWIDLETMRCEDSARPLKSWHGRRYLPRAPRVRPAPPVVEKTDARSPGDRVEVWHNDGWWYGRAIETEDPAPASGRVAVFFPAEGATHDVALEDVRTALSWRGGGEDGGWTYAGTEERVVIAAAAESTAWMDATRAGDAQLCATEEKEKDENEENEEEEEDAHHDECDACGGAGSLVCCDGCPCAYHIACVGETKATLPDGDEKWFCPECVAVPETVKDDPRMRIAHNPPLRVPQLGADASGRPYWVSHGKLFCADPREGAGGVTHVTDEAACGAFARLGPVVGDEIPQHPMDAKMFAVLKHTGAVTERGIAKIENDARTAWELAATAARETATAGASPPVLRGDRRSSIRLRFDSGIDGGGDDLDVAMDVIVSSYDDGDDDFFRADGRPRGLAAATAMSRAVATTTGGEDGVVDWRGDAAWKLAVEYDNRYAVARHLALARATGLDATVAQRGPNFIDRVAAAYRFDWPSPPPSSALITTLTTADASAATCKLGSVKTLLLQLEHDLFGVLGGRWGDQSWRLGWIASVCDAAFASDLAPRLLQLERATHVNAFEDAWHASFVDEKVAPRDEEDDRNFVLEGDGVGPSELGRFVPPSLFHRAAVSLPRDVVRKLARTAGVRRLEPRHGVYGGGDRRKARGAEWVRRTSRSAWIGEVERARSVAALGMSLRALHAHVRWDALAAGPARRGARRTAAADEPPRHIVRERVAIDELTGVTEREYLVVPCESLSAAAAAAAAAADDASRWTREANVPLHMLNEWTLRNRVTAWDHPGARAATATATATAAPPHAPTPVKSSSKSTLTRLYERYERRVGIECAVDANASGSSEGWTAGALPDTPPRSSTLDEIASARPTGGGRASDAAKTRPRAREKAKAAPNVIEIAIETEDDEGMTTDARAERGKTRRGTPPTPTPSPVPKPKSGRRPNGIASEYMARKYNIEVGAPIPGGVLDVLSLPGARGGCSPERPGTTRDDDARARLDAAAAAEALIAKPVTSRAVGAGDAPSLASSPTRRPRLSTAESERCLAVLDILHGARDDDDCGGDGGEKRFLDASFCRRLPPKSRHPEYYDEASHPVDLESIERKTKHRAYASVREFCAECEWVFDNADLFAFFAHENEKQAGKSPRAGNTFSTTVADDAAALRKLFRAKAIEAFVPLAAAANVADGDATTQGGARGKETRAPPRGESLVGRRLSVYWAEDDAWYAALCTAHDKKSGAHKLRYIADLEEEWLNDLDKGGHAREPKPPGPKSPTLWLPETAAMRAPLTATTAKTMCRVMETIERHADAHGRRLADLFYRAPSKEDDPGYHEQIAVPVDLATIAARLISGEHRSAGDFASDFEVMLENATKANEPGLVAHEDARKLRGILRRALGRAVPGYAPPPGPFGPKRRKLKTFEETETEKEKKEKEERDRARAAEKKEKAASAARGGGRGKEKQTPIS